MGLPESKCKCGEEKDWVNHGRGLYSFSCPTCGVGNEHYAVEAPSTGQESETETEE